MVLAVAASLVVIGSSPFVDVVRAWLARALPSHFAPVLGGAVALAAVVALYLGLRHARRGPPWRSAILAVAFLSAAVWFAMMRTGVPEVDAVERVHLVEYGGLAVLWHRACGWGARGAKWLTPVLAGLLIGIADEGLQWWLPGRVGELHDVTLDAVATVCGLAAAVAWHPPASWALAAGSRRQAAAWGTAVSLALAAFVVTVHLGVEIEAGGGARFRSVHSEPALLAAADERASRWQGRPIPAPGRLSREDQYRAEGLWHLQARNAHERAGRWRAALGENQILERFFGPVLDTPVEDGESVARWAEHQQRSVQHVVGASMGPYRSTAEPYPIYLWPSAFVWSGAGLAAAVMVMWAGWAREGGRADRDAVEPWPR